MRPNPKFFKDDNAKEMKFSDHLKEISRIHQLQHEIQVLDQKIKYFQLLNLLKPISFLITVAQFATVITYFLFSLYRNLINPSGTRIENDSFFIEKMRSWGVHYIFALAFCREFVVPFLMRLHQFFGLHIEMVDRLASANEVEQEAFNKFKDQRNFKINELKKIQDKPSHKVEGFILSTLINRAPGDGIQLSKHTLFDLNTVRLIRSCAGLSEKQFKDEKNIFVYA